MSESYFISIVIGELVNIVRLESEQGISMFEVVRKEVLPIATYQVCTPHDGITMDDRRRASTMVIELRLYDPHTSLVTRFVTNGQEPLHQGTGVVNSVVRERKKKKYLRNVQPTHSGLCWVLLRKDAVPASHFVTP